MNRIIGQSVQRKEDRNLLEGHGVFVEDMEITGMLWVTFVRSPHAHARIISIDASAALRSPGIVAILTGHDVHPKYHTNPTVSLAFYGAESAPYSLMAVDTVRHVGEVVAIVVADDRYRARDAADLVAVEYQSLAAVVDPDAALRPDAPRVHEDRPNEVISWQHSKGNVSQAFETAEVIVRERMVNQRIHAVPIEPRAGIAHWDPLQRTLNLWATVQTPHTLRDHVAEVTGVPADRVRVVAPDVGGGFGAKHEDPEYMLLAIASLQVGKPVKWVATRSEDFLGMHQARGKSSFLELSADKEGRITGLRVRHVHDLGAYAKGPEPLHSMTSAMIAVGVYEIPNVEFDVHSAYTHKTPQGPYRGAGRPEGIFLIERGIDQLARELGIDPAEIRLRNAIPAFTTPRQSSGGDMYDSGDYAAALRKALELSDYQGLRQEQARLRAEGRYLGIGISCWVKTGGSGPNPLDPSSNRYEWGRVKVDRSGQVTVYTGSSPHGQGGETVFSQIVAEVLQVPVTDVSVLHGDTATVSYGVGTYGSRGLVTGGMSAFNAAGKVLEKMKKLAAHLLNVGAQDIAYQDGIFRVGPSPKAGVSFATVAAAAYAALARPADMEYGLDEDSFYQPSGLTYNFGSYVAVVEVDVATGDVDLRQLFCVDDQGVIVNPMTVEGQVHGGATQGIGQALFESSVYDPSGQLLTGSLMDYAIPTAEMTPTFVTSFMETPSPLNALGVKGMGEGPTTGAPPAVVNAVVDALAPVGVQHIEMPLTPERVWRAIRAAEDVRPVRHPTSFR